MATVAKRRFIRADGPDKVTGSGRYTADLTLTGMLAAKFRYADTSACPHHQARRLRGAGDPRRDGRGGPHRRRRARRASRPLRAGPHAVRPRRRALRRRGVAAVAAPRRRSPSRPSTRSSSSTSHCRSSPTSRPRSHRCSARARRLGVVRRRRRHGARSQRRLALVDHQGRRRRRAGRGRHRRHQPLRRRRQPRRADRAARRRRPVGGQQGHDLDVDAGAVRCSRRCVRNARAARQPCAHHRAAPRRRIRRQVRLPLRGAHRRPGAQAPSDRCAWCSRAAKSSWRPTGGARAWSSTSPPACATTARSPRAGHWIASTTVPTPPTVGVLPAARGDARSGPYRIPNLYVDAHLVYTNHQPSGSVRAPTAPQACWAIESHTDESPRRSPWIRSTSAGSTPSTPASRAPAARRTCEIGVQQCIEDATKMVGYGRALPDDEAIGVADRLVAELRRAVGRVHQARRGRLGTDHHRRTGMRHRLGHDAADAGGRRAGHAARGLQARLPGHGRGPYDMGATGSQTIFNNGRAVVAAAGQIAEQLKPLAAEHLEASPADIVLADGSRSRRRAPRARRCRSPSSRHRRRWRAADRPRLGRSPPAPSPTPSSCVGEVGMAALSAPQFSCHAVRVRLDRDTGVVRVLEVGARTTRARSSTRPAPTARSRAAS